MFVIVIFCLIVNAYIFAVNSFLRKQYLYLQGYNEFFNVLYFDSVVCNCLFLLTGLLRCVRLCVKLRG